MLTRVLLSAALLISSLFLAYTLGKRGVQAQWDKANIETNAKIALLTEQANKVTVRVETKYVEKEKVIRLKGKEIIREVKVFVPSDSCSLSGGFRVFHDAAANNEVPDATKAADAPSVSATDVATTIARNYEQCNVYIERLKAWQQWARDQCNLNGGCE